MQNVEPKLVVVDKDGTLIKPKSGKTFVQDPEDQEVIPEALQLIQYYRTCDAKVIIASNQGGVFAGYKTLESAIAEMTYCLNQFQGLISHAIFCPDYVAEKAYVVDHETGSLKIYTMSSASLSKYGSGYFRKPRPGMINLASRIAQVIDNTQVLFIGDRDEDKQAAASAEVQFLSSVDIAKTVNAKGLNSLS